MKMCMNHWEKLREAVKARGLDALVADSAEKVARNLVSELEDGQTLDNFDPLMGAHNAILANSMDALGPAARTLFTGDYCPLCVLNEQSREAWEQGQRDGMKAGQPCRCGQCGAVFPPEPESYDQWIDRAADDQVEAWKSFGSEAGA